MDEIIRRLSENRLDEMAMSQDKAIDQCRSLGKQFIEHYHKVYIGGINDIDFDHHCHEMQTWYNDINSIILKSTKRRLTNTDKMDWFFTVGAVPEDFLDDLDEVEEYNKFIIRILYTGEEIVDILSDMLKEVNEDG